MANLLDSNTTSKFLVFNPNTGVYDTVLQDVQYAAPVVGSTVADPNATAYSIIPKIRTKELIPLANIDCNNIIWENEYSINENCLNIPPAMSSGVLSVRKDFNSYLNIYQRALSYELDLDDFTRESKDGGKTWSEWQDKNKVALNATSKIQELSDSFAQYNLTGSTELKLQIANMDGKITAAEQSIIQKSLDDAQAKLAAEATRVADKAELDGKITAAEQATIDASNLLDASYKEYNRVVVKAMSDGVLTEAELALIHGAKVEVDAAKARFTSLESGFTVLNTDLSDTALGVANLDGKITTEEAARISAIIAVEEKAATDNETHIASQAALDGKITAAEQATIDASHQLTLDYKNYNNVITAAMADGVLTPEEEALIADARAHIDASLTRLSGLELKALTFSEINTKLNTALQALYAEVTPTTVKTVNELVDEAINKSLSIKGDVIEALTSDGDTSESDTKLIADASQLPDDFKTLQTTIGSALVDSALSDQDILDIKAAKSAVDVTRTKMGVVDKNAVQTALDAAALDGKITAEENNRVTAIAAEQTKRAEELLARAQVEAELDGKITDAEAARIAAQTQLVADYKNYNSVIVKAMADGVLTPEEEALIADAKSHIVATRKLISDAQDTADSVDGKITDESTARIAAINAANLATAEAAASAATAAAELDGKITDAEQATIDATDAVTVAYKDYNTVVAKALADGNLTTEEADLIAAAKTHIEVAKANVVAAQNAADASAAAVVTEVSDRTAAVTAVDDKVATVTSQVELLSNTDLSATPTLSGDESQYEGASLTLTIDNYSPVNTYSANASNGEVTINEDGTITWIMPPVDTTTIINCTVYSIEPDKAASLGGTRFVSVTPYEVIDDSYLVYEKTSITEFSELTNLDIVSNKLVFEQDLTPLTITDNIIHGDLAVDDFILVDNKTYKITAVEDYGTGEKTISGSLPILDATRTVADKYNKGVAISNIVNQDTIDKDFKGLHNIKISHSVCNMSTKASTVNQLVSSTPIVEGEVLNVGSKENIGKLMLTLSDFATDFGNTGDVWDVSTVDDWFGYAVDISDNKAVVSSPGREWKDGGYVGTAGVFDIVTGEVIAKIVNPNSYGSGSGDYFGTAVAIAGNYVAIGAPQEDNVNGSDAGAVYIYEIVETVDTGIVYTTTLKHTLIDPDAATALNDKFGTALSMDGDRLIVGVPNESGTATDSGKAYIYNVVTGDLLFSLENPTDYGTPDSDLFGTSVSISGSRCIVGAPGEDDENGTESGKAYIFDVADGSLMVKLDNPNPYDTSVNDLFGTSVAITDDKCVVGAPGEDVGAGKAYIFDIEDGSLLITLDDPNAYSTKDDDNFGTAVSIAGDKCLVGAPLEDSTYGQQSGTAYIFNAVTGVLLQRIDDPNAYGTAVSDNFGGALAISDKRCIVGAYLEVDAANSAKAGEAYIFLSEDLDTLGKFTAGAVTVNETVSITANDYLIDSSKHTLNDGGTTKQNMRLVNNGVLAIWNDTFGSIRFDETTNYKIPNQNGILSGINATNVADITTNTIAVGDISIGMSDNGKHFYTLLNTSPFVYKHYRLNKAFNFNTKTLVHTSTDHANLFGNNGVEFIDDGRTAFVAIASTIEKRTLTIPYELKDYTVQQTSGEVLCSQGFKLSKNGLKIISTDSANIYTYDLTTPFDLSTIATPVVQNIVALDSATAELQLADDGLVITATNDQTIVAAYTLDKSKFISQLKTYTVDTTSISQGTVPNMSFKNDFTLSFDIGQGWMIPGNRQDQFIDYVYNGNGVNRLEFESTFDGIIGTGGRTIKTKVELIDDSHKVSSITATIQKGA